MGNKERTSEVSSYKTRGATSRVLDRHRIWTNGVEAENGHRPQCGGEPTSLIHHRICIVLPVHHTGNLFQFHTSQWKRKLQEQQRSRYSSLRMSTTATAPPGMCSSSPEEAALSVSTPQPVNTSPRAPVWQPRTSGRPFPGRQSSSALVHPANLPPIFPKAHASSVSRVRPGRTKKYIRTPFMSFQHPTIPRHRA